MPGAASGSLPWDWLLKSPQEKEGHSEDRTQLSSGRKPHHVPKQPSQDMVQMGKDTAAITLTSDLCPQQRD